ncbi:prepilin-type N-terminal cleavage/methylation domain-containing protein [Loktanella salsilacus]|uniref:prepilin-type N-terminal cleavage/methylation domain-containing protein n=1 Tax=Loktanella salsilacus TaxID=195913 RepID=UPI00370417AE
MRSRDAGVTLVEVLVVLVLVGIMAGAIGLSLGPADRGDAANREATLLIARLNRAADEALLTGAATAFVWGDGTYRFEVRQIDGSWGPHPIELLGTPHQVGIINFSGDGGSDGRYVVDGDLLPATMATLRLTMRSANGSDEVVSFDGVNALQDPS